MAEAEGVFDDLAMDSWPEPGSPRGGGINRAKVSDDEVATLKQLYSTGMTMRQVAQKLNLSVGTVYKYTRDMRRKGAA